ncbi:MAG: putrescine/spermidine ABC transporter permease, partial [Rhizobiaceae bacterium]
MTDVATHDSTAVKGRADPVGAVITAITSRQVILIPNHWLLIYFIVPFLIVFKNSLSQIATPN